MEVKKLFDIGNLYQGYPYGVEVEGAFGSREVHGAFATLTDANNYMHELIQTSPYFGNTVSVKVVKIETPQAGRCIVWQYGDSDKPGEFVYEQDAKIKKTPTGHIVGATYRSAYWGGTYKVIGTHGECGVMVECVEPGGGAHQTPGERWTHSTTLDKRDQRIAG